MLDPSPRKLLFLLLSDAALVVLALALSSVLRIHVELGTAGPEYAFRTPPPLFVIALGLWLFALYQVQAYHPQRSARLWHELQNTVVGHVVASLLFWGCLYITYRDYSRLQSVYFLVLTLILLLARRLLVRLIYHVWGQPARDQRRVVIVGVGENARRVGEAVTRHDGNGLDLLGYVTYERDTEPDATLNRPVLGDIAALASIVEAQSVHEVVIALRWFDADTYSDVADIVNHLQHLAVNIRLAPDYSDLAYFHVSAREFGGLPLLGLREPVLTPFQYVAKRAFDLLFASAALVVCLPLFAAIMLAIRLDSRGAVMLRQERVGQHGRRFSMYKFRTMYADRAFPQIPDGDAAAFLKLRDDPRVTRVGRFLRRTSMDELPQFVNVLLGDMSVVGPRPEVPWMVDRYEWWQRKRFEVPQGMTGWWQINGRADRPMYLNTDDDLFYIQHYSLLLDLQIIARTVFVVLSGRGAY